MNKAANAAERQALTEQAIDKTVEGMAKSESFLQKFTANMLQHPTEWKIGSAAISALGVLGYEAWMHSKKSKQAAKDSQDLKELSKDLEKSWVARVAPTAADKEVKAATAAVQALDLEKLQAAAQGKLPDVTALPWSYDATRSRISAEAENPAKAAQAVGEINAYLVSQGRLDGRSLVGEKNAAVIEETLKSYGAGDILKSSSNPHTEDGKKQPHATLDMGGGKATITLRNMPPADFETDFGVTLQQHKRGATVAPVR